MDFWPPEPESVYFCRLNPSVCGTLFGGQAPACIDLLGNLTGSAFLALLLCFQAPFLWSISKSKENTPQKPTNRTATAKSKEMTTGHLLGPAPLGKWLVREASSPAVRLLNSANAVGNSAKKARNCHSVCVMLIKGQIAGVQHADTAKLCFQKALSFWQVLLTLAGR